MRFIWWKQEKWTDKDTSWKQAKWTDKDTSGKQVKRTDTIWIWYDPIVKDNSRQDVEKDLRWCKMYWIDSSQKRNWSDEIWVKTIRFDKEMTSLEGTRLESTSINKGIDYSIPLFFASLISLPSNNVLI